MKHYWRNFLWSLELQKRRIQLLSKVRVQRKAYNKADCSASSKQKIIQHVSYTRERSARDNVRGQLCLGKDVSSPEVFSGYSGNHLVVMQVFSF